MGCKNQIINQIRRNNIINKGLKVLLKTITASKEDSIKSTDDIEKVIGIKVLGYMSVDMPT